MRLKVLHHGNCFDGCASAALFGRFFEERVARGPFDVTYAPVQHQQGDPFPPGTFDGDVNACVDFRFSPSPALHWWFDHHASAFQPSTDRAIFERDRSGQKFWDPTAPSCTGFIARSLEEHFGWTAPDREELLRWFTVVYRNPPGTDASGIHGTPEQVAEQLEELVAKGANHLLLNPVCRYAETLEALAELTGLK